MELNSMECKELLRNYEPKSEMEKKAKRVLLADRDDFIGVSSMSDEEVRELADSIVDIIQLLDIL
jgi:hypothetical protein